MSSAAVEARDEARTDQRRRALLDAALGVFARFGYRKTSMDEVARAAQMSRQGLYLHFASKEELFRATVKHTLEEALQAALASLRDAERTLEQKLVAAFDGWMGRFVGMMGTDAADLAEAMRTLVGPLATEYEERFRDALARAITAARLGAAYKPAGISARQLADTLAATARGFKYSSESREGFERNMTVAVRALCLPLGSVR